NPGSPQTRCGRRRVSRMLTRGVRLSLDEQPAQSTIPECRSPRNSVFQAQNFRVVVGLLQRFLCPALFARFSNHLSLASSSNACLSLLPIVPISACSGCHRARFTPTTCVVIPLAVFSVAGHHGSLGRRLPSFH